MYYFYNGELLKSPNYLHGMIISLITWSYATLTDKNKRRTFRFINCVPVSISSYFNGTSSVFS